MTQLAIDRGDAHRVGGDEPLERTGDFVVHVFHKNNELAGYCSVLHAFAAARHQRRLRPPPARRGHQLRRHRARAVRALSALGVAT
jgi:hypothetical protein